MSKMDDMRAMREARFGTAAPATAQPATPTKAPRAAATRKVATPPAVSAAGAVDADVRRCGHRAISGRTCTREHGHEAKSHRYS